MLTKSRFMLLAAGLLILAGCASERVVLLPSADGRPSAVVVRDAGGETLLDRPYAATLRGPGEIQGYQASPEDVEKRFAAALAARPLKAQSYLLYFREGSNELTAESQAAFAQMKAEILARSAPEIMVIGHTDRVGSVQANDALSQQRAAAVRTLLIEAGIPADKLEVAGRGEREPLVATADEVQEARNRRVEINVR